MLYGKKNLENKISIREIEIHTFSKKNIRLGLIILVILMLSVNIAVILPSNIDGRELGNFIIIPTILAMLPILGNYLILLFTRILVRYDSKIKIPVQIIKYLSHYYLIGLILHSILFTFVLGLAFTHTILMMEKATYCLVFFLLLANLWIMELKFWGRKWEFYPKNNPRNFFQYLGYIFTLFSVTIFLVFHVKMFNFIWGLLIPLGYISLFWLAYDYLKLQKNENEKTEDRIGLK